MSVKGGSTVKVGAYIVSMDRKTTAYGLEAGKIVFFEKCIQAVHCAFYEN